MNASVRRYVLTSVVGIACTAGTLAAQTFSIEDVLSAPFPTDLVASKGGSFAWVFNAKGVRNVWIAEGPAYKARQVTSYTKDDGQEISSLSFTPDGGILYVRGGAPNRAGEFPNPSSDPAGVERAIWTIRTSGAAPRKVVNAGGYALAPSGKEIAYSGQGGVMVLAIDSGSVPRQLFKARGGSGGLRWSPDGTRIAFVSFRERHSFIGVYDFGAKSLTWIDPSVDQDGEPAWSPDSRRIAFMRNPSQFTDRMFIAEREGDPWSIRVADVSTGVGREVWRADQGPGSVFRNIVAANQLFWTADDRIVFPWEKDGWTHLYSIPSGGGAALLLTPGNGEVEYVTLAEDRRTILYNANIGDIDRRDVFRVASAGGVPVSVTKSTGIEWGLVEGGGKLALLRADSKIPARPALVEGANVRDIAPETLPASFPGDRLVEPQAVMVSATDGMQVPAQLFLPPNLRPGEKRPAVIFFHGGSRRQMLLGWNYGNYYSKAYGLQQWFASQGYIALSVNFRSGIGYGLNFREALNYGAGGASEFNDVMGAGLYLRSRADVDPSRIGLWGGSYGGYLTAMGLSRASDLFAAGVDIHGVHDWNPVIRGFIPSYDPLKQVDMARVAFESSPMSSVKGWRSPVLLIHGDDDRNVPFTETGSIIEQLRKQGVEIEQLVFPDDVHDFLLWSNWVKAYKATGDFFARKLVGQTARAGN
jgi:dipeptidyl aminopeptidase/acylaminoacyl peptidase